jgi:ABC-type bacteriocin/lantibiotic exporter with double-glycine peptidase domain
MQVIGIKEFKLFFRIAAFLLSLTDKLRHKLMLTFIISLSELLILISLPLVGAKIINALAEKNDASFKDNLWLLFCLTMLQLILNFINGYLIMIINEQAGNSLRKKLTDVILKKDLPFYENFWIGDMTARTLNDTSAIKGYLTQTYVQAIIDLLTVMVVIFVLANLHPILAILTIITAPITIWSGRAFRPRIESLTLKVRESIGALTGSLQTWFSRSVALKTHSLEIVAYKQFSDKSEDYTRKAVCLGFESAKMGAINMLLLGIPSLIIFAYGGFLTLNERLTVGSLFAFMTYTSYFNGPIQRLIGIINLQLPSISPIYHRIIDILKEDREILPDYSPDFKVVSLSLNELKFSFKNSSFSLSIDRLIALKGEAIGISGKNGSGKSTLSKVIKGLYVPDSGLIRLIDPENQELTNSALNPYISILPQEQTMFEGTLLDNVTLFDPSPDYKKLDKISRDLDLAPMISSLEKGWQTVLQTETSVSLSGGQKQKIGLARVLYLNKPIVILDEPESSFDEIARPMLLAILKALKRERIILIVSHSADILDLCDREYRLQEEINKTGHFKCAQVTKKNLAI